MSLTFSFASIAVEKIRLKINVELRLYAGSDAVVKLPKVRAGDVVLNVARVEIVGQIKQRNAHADSFIIEKRQVETLRDLHVEREIRRKAPGFVACADEL